MSVDTCNLMLEQALGVFAGAGGINDQLGALQLNPAPAPVDTILILSAPVETYEKTTSLKYPVATIYCQRLKNTQTEKFRMFSGVAQLVLDVRVSGSRAQDVDANLNSYVEAACQVLDASRGTWTSIGTYAGAYDVKFQPIRLGGKQFTKSAQIEFDVQINR